MNQVKVSKLLIKLSLL